MKIIGVKRFTPGDKKIAATEELIDNLDFKVFKFNNRPQPPANQTLILSCFSEFGCEIVGTMYCIPKILRENPGKYVIVVGWYGREYLYRHLVDEFWEVKEEHMWLRDYARAFHNESKNVKRIEKKLQAYGRLVNSEHFGRAVLGVRCNSCGVMWGNPRKVENCIKCQGTNLTQSMFADVNKHKPDAKRLPEPSAAHMAAAAKYLGKNPVGIFARGRNVYGRNLQPEFYVGLIKMLEDKGYTPIWLGEKQSTQPCPVEYITDFSRMDASRDLELTLAIVKQLKFTIQFWTASTRLAAMMGVPYIIFESPDQIWGNGQEGYRLNLCTFGPKKMAICHYLNVYDDNESGLKLAAQCVEEVEQGNFEDIFGMLESGTAAQDMKQKNTERIGG